MITDRSVFDVIVGGLDATTFRTRRLPKQVFQDGYGEFSCIEFDIFSGRCFWALARGLAAAVGDSKVMCVALDPDPVEYFFKEFGMYGAFQIDTTATAEQYFAALSSAPETSPADSLLHNSEVLTWCSPSLDWLIWGERSLTVAMIAARKGSMDLAPSIAEDSGIRLFSPDDALPNLISANFRDGKVPADWEEEFRRNYSKMPAATFL